MSTIPKEVVYEDGEIVWHKAFKIKVKYCGISLPKTKTTWHSVQLPNGGFHETQLIEKYNECYKTNQQCKYGCNGICKESV